MVLLSSEDVFKRPLLADDPVLHALHQQEELTSVLSVIGVLLSSFKTVLVRQLQRYISGPLSSPDAAMRVNAAAAPSHNIWAERCLGMIDSAIRRAPNASIAFVDGKVKFKVNHTMK